MTQISSDATFFYKRVFPIIWLGIVLFIALSGSRAGTYPNDITVLVGPAVILVIGFIVMKLFVWDLVDKVMDCGNYLLVTRHGEELRVPLSSIMNVNVSARSNPKRVTLRLVSAGKFGDEIAFMPPMGIRLNPFAKDPILENLIVRIDQARATRPL